MRPLYYFIRVTGSLLLFPIVLSAPFPPPNSSRFVLYFGANESGPADNATFLQLASRGGLAGYGWQAYGAVSNFSHGGEANLLTAARALRAFAPAQPIFV
jgi:hypothetical protein